jgi:uncharacterized protein (DUF1800 family)
MPTRVTALILITMTALPAVTAAAQDVTGADAASRDSALHLLNRAAWGPRPGDVERLLAMGIDAWLTSQLAPEGLADGAAEAFVRQYAVLRQSTAELGRMLAEQQQARARRQMVGDSQPPPPPDRASGLARANLELQQAAVARAILSERQLYEVLVDVWTNHFNVFMAKGLDRVLMADYIRSAIRPNALGRFEDLLVATARHPAMLFYLDNAQSVAPGAAPPRRARGRDRREPAQMPRGLNENYARELLELHTLGVDGGYSQADVVAVARILTGWSIRRRGGGATFAYMDWAHDRGAKTVMDREFPAGRGEDEGRALLRWLANHPQTMRHVSARLCARFVADDPPDGCVDAAVHAWRDSRGDLRAVVGAILRSPEFWAPEHRAAKLKTPLEFLVSAARALDARPDTTLALAVALRRLDQPLYLYSAPTGYPERMESWVSSDALFERFNMALAIASGRAPGLVVNLEAVVPATSVAALPGAIERVMLHGRAGPATRETLEREAAGLPPADARRLLVGLALGSPEFQRQ